MGKSLPSATRLQQFSRIITSDRIHRPNRMKPVIKAQSLPSPEQPAKFPSHSIRADSVDSQLKLKTMDQSSETQTQTRLPLAAVVSDCVKRWFQDTLKEAKAGDSAMQVLVGQMYCGGYGVTRDAQKGRAWINRASKSRSSAWRVGDKHPGYNASDSDSDDTKADAK